MNVERVGVEAARRLLSEGFDYLDVRSEVEFAAGHPPKAYNIPVSLVGETSFVPNPDFLRVALSSFQPGHRLVVGCQTGGRSRGAVLSLAASGFSALFELRTGFDGCRDAFGRREPGWGRAGLPTEAGDGGPRGYASLLELAASGATAG